MGRFSGFFTSGGKKAEEESPPPYVESSNAATEKADSKNEASKVPSTPSTAHPETNEFNERISEKPTTTNPAPSVSTPAQEIVVPVKQEEVIKFSIGPDKKYYELPKAKVLAESGHIRRGLAPGGCYDGYDHLTKTKMDPRAFELIQTWLNTAKLPEMLNETNLVPSGSAMANIATFWQAARDLGMTYLCNDINDETRRLFRVKGWVFVWADVWKLHEMNLVDTPLYNMVKSIAAFDLCKYPKDWHTTNSNKVQDLENVYKNQELMAIVLKHTLKFQLEPWGDPRGAYPGKCYYHDHSEGCKHFKVE